MPRIYITAEVEVHAVHDAACDASDRASDTLAAALGKGVGEREAFEAWWNTGADTLGIPVDSFDLEYKCKEFARAAWQARAAKGGTR